MHFLVLLVIFATAYFVIFLPIFQALSKRIRGRRFVIRLGTPWKLSDPEHRWDVVLSFISFVLTLGVSLFVLDLFLPLEEVRP